MDAVRKIVLISCFLAIALSILDMLYPNKKFEKQVHLIFSLVFIIGIITPFLTGGIAFAIPDIERMETSQTYSTIQNTVQNEYKSEIEANVNRSLFALLQKNQTNAKEISTKINIADDNSISIIEVEVMSDDSGEDQKIRTLIQGEIGQEVNVVIKQGSQ